MTADGGSPPTFAGCVAQRRLMSWQSWSNLTCIVLPLCVFSGVSRSQFCSSIWISARCVGWCTVMMQRRTSNLMGCGSNKRSSMRSKTAGANRLLHIPHSELSYNLLSLSFVRVCQEKVRRRVNITSGLCHLVLQSIFIIISSKLRVLKDLLYT